MPSALADRVSMICDFRPGSSRTNFFILLFLLRVDSKYVRMSLSRVTMLTRDKREYRPSRSTFGREVMNQWTRSSSSLVKSISLSLLSLGHSSCAKDPVSSQPLMPDRYRKCVTNECVNEYECLVEELGQGFYQCQTFFQGWLRPSSHPLVAERFRRARYRLTLLN